MSDPRSFASEGRSVRLMFGSQRVLVEKNSTGSAAVTPFCVKSRNRDFLAQLLRDATLDPDRIFKGSYNHMVFLNKQEACAALGSFVGLIPLSDGPLLLPAHDDSSDTDDTDDGPI